MRIGFAGAHRTGKSTLAQELGKKLNLNMLDNPAVTAFNMLGLHPDDNLTFDRRLMVQMLILERFKAAAKPSVRFQGQVHTPRFVCDRTPLDYAAYMLSEVNSEVANDLMQTDEDFLAKYLADCNEAMNELDLVFIVQPGIEMVAEKGKAVLSRGLQEHLNDLIIARATVCDTECILIPREMTDFYDRLSFVYQNVMQYIEKNRM